jgi:hypothetical protein
MTFEVEVYSIRDGIPRGRKSGFASITDAQHYVRQDIAGNSSYWQVFIYDGAGNKVMRGVRSSIRGGCVNGKRFIWTEV